MTARIARDPSPLRSALVHSSLGAMTLFGVLGLGGTVVHFIGDADAASPAVRVALFESDGSAPALKTRLAGDSDQAAFIMADTQLPDEDTDEGDLGVEYGEPRRTQVAVRTVATPPVEAQPEGVRINGQMVRPGESYTQLQQAALRNAIAETIVPDIPEPTVQVADVKPAAPSGPFEKNSRPFENPEGKPTVSIVLGGLGINYKLTMAAIDELPPEVTLSFAPTAGGLSTWVRRARAAGHEVLIEMPMEPYDYGREGPHPNVLQVAVGPDTNRARLTKMLGRTSGYMGIMNYKGAKFATDSDAAAPVLALLRERGVALIEDGSLNKSVFAQEAVKAGVTFGQAGAWIDARPEAEQIENQLLTLEMQARETGIALGTGSPFPVTIDMLKEWTTRLEGKGIVLAPASYFAKQSTASGQMKTAALDPAG